MNNKVLFTVISCNRLYYLKNCVRSIVEFNDAKQYDLLIVDNNSVEPGMSEYLEYLNSKYAVHVFNDRCSNELYRAMNFSVNYAMKMDYDIIHFIQDDYQYLYALPDLIPAVRRVFKKRPEIGQISTTFAWKRKKCGRLSFLKAGKYCFARLDNKMMVDAGFTRTAIYKKVGLYPHGLVSYDQDYAKTQGFGKNRYKHHINGELWFGSQCRKAGFWRAVCLHPNLGMMFDCSYVRGNHRFGNYFPAPERYYLKPLDLNQIAKISQNNAKRKLSYAEEIQTAWGWMPTTLKKHNREGKVSKI